MLSGTSTNKETHPQLPGKISWKVTHTHINNSESFLSISATKTTSGAANQSITDCHKSRQPDQTDLVALSTKTCTTPGTCFNSRHTHELHVVFYQAFSAQATRRHLQCHTVEPLLYQETSRQKHFGMWKQATIHANLPFIFHHRSQASNTHKLD